MIFNKPLDRLVLEARKTQTRQPIKHTPNGTTLPCRWKVGHDYAIERPSGKPEDARIQITAIRTEQLGSIDYAGIRAEGHKTRDEFADTWLCQHDHSWPPIENCHACDGDGTIDCDQCWNGQVRAHPLDAHPCPSCHGTGEQFTDINPTDIIARFDNHHATTRVWVITFKLAATARYLAHPIPGRSGDYTRNRDRAIDDLEVIDPADLGATWRQHADARHTAALARADLITKLRRLAA